MAARIDPLLRLRDIRDNLDTGAIYTVSEIHAALGSAITCVERALAAASATKSLRDSMAMAALPAIVSNADRPWASPEKLALWAYALADAMLEVRKGPRP